MNQSDFTKEMVHLSKDLNPNNRRVILEAAKRSARSPVVPTVSLDSCVFKKPGNSKTWRKHGYPTRKWFNIAEAKFNSPNLKQIMEHRGANRDPFHYHNSMYAALRPQIDNSSKTLTKGLDVSKRLVDVKDARRGPRADGIHQHFNNVAVSFELCYTTKLTAKYVNDRNDNNHSTNKINFIGTGWSATAVEAIKEHGGSLFTILVKGGRPILAKVDI